MKLIKIIEEKINQYNYKILNKKLEKIFSDDVLYYRSCIVWEAIRIRIKALKEFYNISDNQSNLPDNYRSLFFDQFFELGYNRINTPEYYAYEYALANSFEEDAYILNKIEIIKYFKMNGASENHIFEKIKSEVQIHKTRDNSKNTIVDKEGNLIPYKKNYKLLEYPIIIFDEKIKQELINILSYYYNQIEMNRDEESKFIMDDLQYSGYRNLLHYDEILYPGLILKGKNICYPIIEKLIQLEASLINQYIVKLEKAISYFDIKDIAYILEILFGSAEILSIDYEIQKLLSFNGKHDKSIQKKNKFNVRNNSAVDLETNFEMKKNGAVNGTSLTMNPHIKARIKDEMFLLKDITLTIISENDVEIKIRKKKSFKLSYVDFGFYKVSGKKSIKSKTWETLLDLTRYNITTQDPINRTRIDRLNDKLQEQFGINEEFFEIKKRNSGYNIYKARFSFQDRFYRIKKDI
ncbi:MAG: hypothetical protein P9L97_09725 [Candidatus Tenebribacter davisii]|nr:hypothetical protein [Candidatus Tenebribacter davisii]